MQRLKIAIVTPVMAFIFSFVICSLAKCAIVLLAPNFFPSMQISILVSSLVLLLHYYVISHKF